MGFQQNHFTSDSTSVAASTGLKNYIAQGTFEAGSTIGWSLGTTGTITNGIPTGTPTFGSGASANLTISATSVSPLSGRFSMQYQHVTNQTVQGNMVATDPLQIDLSDAGKVLSFKFNYLAAVNPSNGNWSGTSSNSFGVAVFDVVNNSWVGIAGGFNLVQSSGVGVATGTFQTAINTTSLRFVFYNAQQTSVVTGGGAITVLLDDFFLGPQVTSIAPAMSDWQSYVPSWTSSGTAPVLNNGTITGKWRRVGSNIEASVRLVMGSTTTFGTGEYNFSLPSGLSIDTTVRSINDDYRVGYGTVLDNGVNRWFVFVNVGSTTTVKAIVSPDGTTGFVTSNTPVQSTVPITFGVNDLIDISFTVPITGFSSNTVQSADTDTRVVAGLVSNSNTSIAGGGGTTVPIFSVKSSDTHGAFNISTSQLTIPVTGFYVFGGAYSSSASITGTVSAVITYKVDYLSTLSLISRENQQTTSSISVALNGKTTPVFLNAGTVVTPGLSITSNPFTGSNSAAGTNFSWERLSGPAVVQATETVAAKYYRSSGQTVTNNTATVIDFNVKQFDTHNAVSGSGSSWRFTAPISGLYSVKAVASFTGLTSGVTIFYGQVAVASGVGAIVRQDVTPGGNFGVQVSADVKLLAGQVVYYNAYQGNGADRVTNVGDECNISIVRVGNY